MRQLVTGIIRWAVFRAPWGVREVIFNACVDRIGPMEVGQRIFRRLNIAEVAANGDRGVVTSASGDLFVLPEYAKTGTFAETIMKEFVAFFGSGGGTYLDIGANIGMTTIPIARNPLVHCIAFEPEPANFQFLRRNIARNAPGENVELHQVALFDRRGAMSLALAENGNIGDHRLTGGNVEGRQSIEIPTVPLDDYSPNIKYPLAVKIDTQGAEPFILAGGATVLSKAGLLAMEFCPYLMEQLRGDPRIVIDLVCRFDRVAIMPGGVAEPPKFISPAEARLVLENKLANAADSDSDYLDILAVRG